MQDSIYDKVLYIYFTAKNVWSFDAFLKKLAA